MCCKINTICGSYIATFLSFKFAQILVHAQSMWYSALVHVCEKISDTRGDHLVPTVRDVIYHLEMSLTYINYQ